MNKKTTTFQENIRNTFISYAIIPSLILVCLAMLLFYWSWNYSIIHYNRQDNEQITHTLEAIENTWSTEVSNLCELAKEASTQKITDIYEIIYAADRCICWMIREHLSGAWKMRIWISFCSRSISNGEY